MEKVNMNKRTQNKENKKISGKEDNIKIKSFDKSAEEIDIPTEDIEKLEPIFDEINEISNEIEEKGSEILENTQNPTILEKNNQILGELYNKSEFFLKKLSSQLANYPKEIANSLRDRRIKKKANHLYKRFRNNDLTTKYTELRNQDKNEDKDKLNKLKEKALRSFDSKYNGTLSLLKTIESENWGNSKNKFDTIESVDFLFKNIVREGIYLERYDEIFNIIKIYENSAILNSAGNKKAEFSIIIDDVASHLYYKKEKELPPNYNSENISELCRNDPYLIVKYLDKRHSLNSDEYSDFFEKQVDRIIEEFPNNNVCNLSAVKLFEKCLYNNPEKYGLDPQNKQVIFNSFKLSQTQKSSNYLSEHRHFFLKELGNLPEEDVNKIVELYSYYDINERKVNVLLSATNLSERDFENIFKKINRNKLPSGEEREIKYSKESLLENFKEAENPFIPFFKYKQFNLDVETRILFFNNIMENSSSKGSFIFLIQILSSFKSIFEGIPEEKCDELINKLVEKAVDGELKDIRILHTLLPEYDIPLKYREQINKTFSKSYARNSESIGKIFGEQRNPARLSKQEEWLIGKNEIKSDVELEFYEQGNMNDLRHFFFKVIEGEKEAVNKDLLIRKYAERIYELGPEEFIDIFVIRKLIPMSYSGIFVEKFNSSQCDSLLSQLEECSRLNQISKKEQKDIFIELITKGNFKIADVSLNNCLAQNILENDEEEELFEKFVKNIVNQSLSDSNINTYALQTIMGGKYNSQNITNEEKNLLFRKFFEELIKHEKLHNNIVEINDSNRYYLKTGFPDEKSREDYVNKLLVSNNSLAVSKLLDGYLRNIDIKREYNDHPILSLIDKEKFESLFSHGLSMDKLQIDITLANYFRNLSKEKQEIFLKNILSKKDILMNANGWEEIKTFCSCLAREVENDRHNESKDRSISEEDAEKIFYNIFSSSKFSRTEVFYEFFNYRMGFLRYNKEILKEFIKAIETKGDAQDKYRALREFKSSDEPIFSEDQVKEFSINILEYQDMQVEIYRMYLDSKPGNMYFYIDQNIFDTCINNMCQNYRRNDIESTINFLDLQRKTKNSKKGDENIIVLSDEQEDSLVKKILAQDMDVSDIVKLFDYDKELFYKSLDSVMQTKSFPRKSLERFIVTKNEISDNSFNRIISYYFDTTSTPDYLFNNICDRYGQNPIFLEEIKNKINNLKSIENRSIYKSKLLQNDLLNQEELKNFYEEIRAQSNVQSQVILSAEVLGSLVYRDQLEKTNNIFESESEETKKSIEYISSFVKKYSLESKGRTIAVMLFSKEYLPERTMGEVIEKVANTLSKYERVLNQHEYKGIPSGLNVSLGLEYEITNSTAVGYKEVTERELKNDIVRLSTAAHIGNGRDAVHEIATRPTTSPYLLLLEMQILDNLKYIDLNFDYSPSFQKGARGYHLTVGGETGLFVNANTNFLQNSILAASWGGIHAGETGKKVSGGRGVTLRSRDASGGNNNIKVFENATNSVELRSLSIDKMESFQRAVVTAYNGAIAIQALEKYTNCTSDTLYKFYESDLGIKSETDFIKELEESGKLKEGYNSNKKNMKIVYIWAELISKIKEALDYHNNEFLEGETSGYLDKNEVWVDSEDFGGTYNRSRFDSVVSSIDPTLSVEEYVNGTKIDINELFSSFDVELADNLTKINNLFLKPDHKIIKEGNKNKTSLGGDQANAISMLEVTKLNNRELEYRTDSSYLRGTVFDTLGERREGYYYVQGGSERMITHACQIALLNFNKKMEEILKN